MQFSKPPVLLRPAMVFRAQAFVCAITVSCALSLPPNPATCSGSVNAQAALDGGGGARAGAVANGTRWTVAVNGSAPLTVLHLYGDVYAMNYAYGQLMAAEVAAALPASLDYLYAQVRFDLNCFESASLLAGGELPLISPVFFFARARPPAGQRLVQPLLAAGARARLGE